MKKATFDSGSPSISSTTWAEAASATGGPGPGGWDLTLSEVQAGDEIRFGLRALISNAAPVMLLDVATVVGGTLTNAFSKAGAFTTAVSPTFLYVPGGVTENVLTEFPPYTVVAGDIENGWDVTLRLMAAVDSGSRLINASGTHPVSLWAYNDGPLASG